MRAPASSSDVAVLAGLGVFVERDALDREACAALRAAMIEAPSTPSTLATGVVDDTQRRTRRARLAVARHGPLVEHVQGTLETLRPRIDRFFGRPSTAIESLQFLVYDEGAFFLPHVDTGAAPELPSHVRLRATSIVLFVSDDHRGGELVLYGLFPDPRAREIGIPVASERGTLIAFPSELLHEVQPVTAGVRCTVATWLLS